MVFICNTVMITMFLTVSSITYSENKTKMEAVKAGLEECPIEVGSYKTVWVKNCTEYSKEHK